MSQHKLRIAILILLFGFGMTAVVVATGPIAEPDAALLYTLSGEQPGSTFGWVGANLGDINGDGVNDIITSAPWFSVDGTTFEGKIYVFSGADGSLLNSATGSGFELLGYSTTSAGDVDGDGTPDYIAGGVAGSHAIVFSGATHSVLLDLYGTGSDGFGASVAGAGDVNLDGYGDLIIGATSDDSSTGKVYLLSGADGSEIWSHAGGGPGQRLGSAVGLVGDVNGDGIPDQVAGSDGIGDPNFGGAAYVYSGVDGSILHTLTPEDPSLALRYGLFFASGAGDMDGDGVPDIYIGDFAENAGNGGTYVYSGANGRLLHHFKGFTGEGIGPGRGVDDIDGDGHSDLIIGAYTYSRRDAAAAGRVYAISGGTGKTIDVMTGTIPGDWFGGDALAVGDVNGDGLTDYMITAYGLTAFGLDVGHAYIVAGQPMNSR